MFINKVLELYREACKHGLSVSLSINNMNGQESFSLATIPGPDLAGRPERRRRPRGGRRQRRRRQDQQECSARATQPAAVAPSYAAVVRSPPSPLQPSTAKRAKHSSAAVERAVATYTAAESADEAAEGTPCDATNTTFSTMDACTAVPAAVVSAPATALAGRAAAAAAVEHPRPPPPFTMRLRRRAVSFSSPSPSPIIFSTPSPSTTPLSPLQQLDGLTSPDPNPYPNPSASPPTITPPDQTPNPPSPFSSKLTYNSISPILSRSCTLCEETLRAQENLIVRRCNFCYEKIDGSNFYQQFCARKLPMNSAYFSVFLCTDCYNTSSTISTDQQELQQKYCHRIHNNKLSLN